MCKQVEAVVPERIKCILAGFEEGLSAGLGRWNFFAISDGGVSWQKLLSDQTGFRLECRATNHEDHHYCSVVPREKVMSAYLDDIYINKDVSSVLHIHTKLAQFSLDCKDPEWLKDGVCVLGLDVKEGGRHPVMETGKCSSGNSWSSHKVDCFSLCYQLGQIADWPYQSLAHACIWCTSIAWGFHPDRIPTAYDPQTSSLSGDCTMSIPFAWTHYV